MKKSKFSLGLAVGAVLGGVAAMFLTPKTGKENREMAKKKIDEFKKYAEDKKVEDIVKDIFGKTSVEGKKLYEQARKELNTRLDEVKANTSEIDRQKYKAVVDDVIGRLQEEKEATKGRMAQLKDYLLARWDSVEDMAKDDSKKVVKELKKETSSKRSPTTQKATSRQAKSRVNGGKKAA